MWISNNEIVIMTGWLTMSMNFGENLVHFLLPRDFVNWRAKVNDLNKDGHVCSNFDGNVNYSMWWAKNQSVERLNSQTSTLISNVTGQSLIFIRGRASEFLNPWENKGFFLKRKIVKKKIIIICPEERRWKKVSIANL